MVDVLLEESRVVPDFQVSEPPGNIHFPFHLCRFPQYGGNQNAPLPIHFDNLTEITGPRQKLLPRRMMRGKFREFLLDLFPFLQGIDSGVFAGIAGYVELRSGLPQFGQKVRRNFYPPFLVDRRQMVAPQHTESPSPASSPRESLACTFYRQYHYATLFTTSGHFVPLEWPDCR